MRKAGANRVPRGPENNGDDGRRLLGSQDCGSRRCDDDIDLEPDELGRDLSEALGASLRQRYSIATARFSIQPS